MKTILKITALVLAASFTVTVVTSLLGVALPAALSPTTLFGALVASLMFHTVVGDYTRAPRLAWRYAPVARAALSSGCKATHPLAA